MATPVPPASYPAPVEAKAKAMAVIIVPALFILGVFLLALSAMVFHLGNSSIVNPTQEQTNNNLNLRVVYSPILRNLGMFFVLAAIFGGAAAFDRIDPVARILMLVIALIATLLLLTSQATLFG